MMALVWRMPRYVAWFTELICEQPATEMCVIRSCMGCVDKAILCAMEENKHDGISISRVADELFK